MTAKSNILEGLHVLLVSEDEARVSALAKALRDRKASVGDVKARSRESLALRGADLVVVDSRSLESTRSSVNEMRGDVRARWASIMHLDYAKLVLDDGAVMLGSLETEVAPLVTADRELTERARNEETFEVSLRPLGPSRMLRALAAAGPTMHVEINDETLSGVVDLSNELLVCAFAQRGADEKWEAWTALVRILGLLDATVRVSRRSHPSAMNIMEPIDQALEVAAQERHSTADQIASEERAARARVAVDFAVTGAHPAMRQDGTFAKIEPDNESLLPAPVAAKPAPKRTLIGVAMPAAAAPATGMAPAAPPVQSRYAYHADASEQKAPPPTPSRTLLGVAPGALPALAGLPRPIANIPVPNLGKPAQDKPLAPAAPAAAPAAPATARRVAQPFASDPPTQKQPMLAEAARVASVQPERDWAGEMLTAARHGAETVPFDAVDTDDELPLSVPPDLVEEHPTMVSRSAELLDFLDSKGDNDVVPDLPDDGAADHEAAPEPARAPATAFASASRPTPEPSLLAAIGEEVETAGFSAPPGAKPIEHAAKKREPVQAALTRFVRKPRTLVLLLLLLVVVSEYYVVTWFQRGSEELEQKAVAKQGPLPIGVAPSRPSAPSKPAPAAETEPPVVPQDAPAVAGAEPATDTKAATAAPSEPAAKAPAAPNEPPAAVEAAPNKAVLTQEPAVAEDEEPTADAPGVDALVRAGAKLLAAGNAAGARDEFARAVAADGRNPHARAGLAEAMLALSDAQNALTQIEEAVKLRPRRARYRVTQGDVLMALGKQGQAREAWQKALELDSSDREAKKRLGK